MFSGNRGAFFAAGLIVGVGLALLFLVWAVPDFRDPSFANEYYEQWQATTTDNQEEQDKTSRTWVRGLRGWVYSEDTAAQWLMALLGFSATVVSLLALIWLKATWAETKRSADAAVNAVEETTRIGNLQLRAYLNLASVEMSELKADAPIKATVTILNTGNTPARRVRAWAHATLSKENRPQPARDYGIIAPNGEIEIKKAIDVPLPIDRIKSERAHLYIYGRVEYVDMFDSEHRTDFRRVYSMTEDGGYTFKATKDGNEVT